VKNERQVALFQPRARIAFGLPGAFIPHHDGAAAVFALRYRALESAVGVILCPDRQSLIAGIGARAFRDRPTQQNAVQLQPKIVVKARSVVL